MSVKDIIREVCILFHIDLTKNIKYDRLTKAIMKKYIQHDDNCVDVGCHKGEILNLILKYSPKGNHYAFEPIPYLYKALKNKFKNNVKILPYALSDESGISAFQLVKNAPAYSGIKKRKYAIKHPEIEEIEVEVKTLDDIISANEKIDFIKIDVEGGEYGVLKGGQKTLFRSQPIILFEFGKGASDYYGTKPKTIYDFITRELDLKIFTLQIFLKEGVSLKENEFIHHFDANDEYYFVAAP